MSKILGISPDSWISSAAILVDGKVLAACPEERFNRRKMSTDFPKNAINFCLKKANLKFNDLESIVIPWNPGNRISSASNRYTAKPQWRGDYLYAYPSQILKMMGSPEVSSISQLIENSKSNFNLRFLNHHQSHIASCYYPSNFSRAAILTIDGRGDEETGTFSIGENNKVSTFQTTLWPHSIGLLYASITEYLGFSPHSDEWKVMALAAYGEKNSKYFKKICELFDIRKYGQYELDLSFFTYYLFDKQPKSYNYKLLELLGPDRNRGEPILKRHRDIAAALQQAFEIIVLHQLNFLYKETKISNLCIAGGAAMNSAFNGKIIQKTRFKSLYIPAFPDDTGVSIGATLYQYYKDYKNTKRFQITHNYFGPSYTNLEISDILASFKIKGKKYNNIEKIVAKKVVQGKLIGWFQGQMEFGQRALGNRSIIADPRLKGVKDKLNLAVKFREKFRPFAPAVLEEKANDYFDLPKNVKVPFMECVYPVKKEKQKHIPSVVFVDGSGRLQTVSKKTNPRFHKLIKEFDKLTGIPIIINTSFNLNGEPIVCTPADAIKTFFSCGLDVLVLENWLIEK